MSTFHYAKVPVTPMLLHFNIIFSIHSVISSHMSFVLIVNWNKVNHYSTQQYVNTVTCFIKYILGTLICMICMRMGQYQLDYIHDFSSDYPCALQRDILLQGRLYLSENCLCFYSNVFRGTKVMRWGRRTLQREWGVVQWKYVDKSTKCKNNFAKTLAKTPKNVFTLTWQVIDY